MEDGIGGSNTGVFALLGGTGGRLFIGTDDGTDVDAGSGVLTGLSVDDVEMEVEELIEEEEEEEEEGMVDAVGVTVKKGDKVGA